MKKTSKPLVFFGTEDFSATSLKKLIQEGFNIAAVVTKPDSKKGRGHKTVEPLIKTIATKHNIPVWQPQKVIEIEENIKKIPNVAGVLVSYGKIIPKSTLKLFSPGIINVHPSLLPKYRGPSPIESAILHKDKETGISIIQLTPEMDAGPIYCQKEVLLTGKETRPELYKKLAHEGAELLAKYLLTILGQTLTPTSQDNQEATYCQLLRKQDGWLEPKKMTAAECERHIRAYLGFPRSKLSLFGHECIITAASVVSTQSSAPLVIQCRENSFLSIEKLIAPSGKLLDAPSFLRGYKA
ncbi:methionyl-tRNA formyltransferase [Candidatus Saccharibacteria bacterium]|nr:methionyl-tRNA formyltransferase [Candidatus Saccharibacteria bacterium]